MRSTGDEVSLLASCSCQQSGAEHSGAHAQTSIVFLYAAAVALTIGMIMSKKPQRFQLYDLLFTLSPGRACIFKLAAARTCQLYDLLFALPPTRGSQNTRNRKVESRLKEKQMYYLENGSTL